MSDEISPEVLAVLDRIRNLRIKKELTVLDLSLLSGVARSYLFYSTIWLN